MAGVSHPAASDASDTYRVAVRTTAGDFEVEVYRSWAPHGADRFLELVAQGYYDDSRFFRVVAGRWAQFGIAGLPALAAAWRSRTMPDDRPAQSNQAGRIAFANTGPDTRSTQVFINLCDNAALLDHEPGFAPFGQVVAGMQVVESLYAGHGEAAGGGMRAGGQDLLFADGNRYLDQHFPELSRLLRIDLPGP